MGCIHVLRVSGGAVRQLTGYRFPLTISWRTSLSAIYFVVLWKESMEFYDPGARDGFGSRKNEI